MNRWRIPDWLEREVRQRDRECVYCRVPLLEAPPAGGSRKAVATWDHIVNDARIVTPENIARCCSACNASKGTKTLAAWLESSYCARRGISPDTVADVVKAALASTLRLADGDGPRFPVVAISSELTASSATMVEPWIVDRLRAWAATKPEIRRLALFGSRVRGEARADSDLDIAFDASATVPLDVVQRWHDELAAWCPHVPHLESFGAPLPRRPADPPGDLLVRDEVQREGRLILER